MKSVFKTNDFKKAASTIEYAVLIIMILTSLFVMKDLFLRYFNGRWKSSGDTFAWGRQHKPGGTTACAYAQLTPTYGVWYDETCYDRAVTLCAAGDVACENVRKEDCGAASKDYCCEHGADEPYGNTNCNGFSSGLPKAIDGKWGSYSPCSATECGATGTQTQICDGPAPAAGGRPCGWDGSQPTTRSCPGTCPVRGGWSDWSPCNCNTLKQTRKCDSPPPSNGGDTCPPTSQTNDGSSQDCSAGDIAVCAAGKPVDGKWSDWKCGVCSKTCGTGQWDCTRTCDGQANGGQDCSKLDGGKNTKTENCNTQVCVTPPPGSVDGQWSSWTCGGCTTDGSCAANGKKNCTRTCVGRVGAGKDCAADPDGTTTSQQQTCTGTPPGNNYASGGINNGSVSVTYSCCPPGTPSNGKSNCGYYGPSSMSGVCQQNTCTCIDNYHEDASGNCVPNPKPPDWQSLGCGAVVPECASCGPTVHCLHDVNNDKYSCHDDPNWSC